MNLIDKEHIAPAEIGQQRSQIAGLFDRGPGGDTHVDTHLIGDNGGERCLAESRGSVQKHMVKGLPSHLGGIDEDAEIILGLLLADVLGDGARAQRTLVAVLGEACGRGDDLLVDFFGKINTHSLYAHFTICLRTALIICSAVISCVSSFLSTGAISALE